MNKYVNRIQNIYCDKCEDEECLECNAVGIAKNIENEIRADERNSFFNFDEVIKIECEKARADTIEEFYNRCRRANNYEVAYREMIGIC